MKNIKHGECPECKKRLARRKGIRIKNIKPTKCNYCGFLIENPYSIFKNEKEI